MKEVLSLLNESNTSTNVLYKDRLITNCFSGQFLGWVWRCALVRNAENRGKNLYLWSYELIFFLMIFYVKSNLDLSFNW